MVARRTSISTSTHTTPPRAATDDAWPDGKALDSSRASGLCQSGRSRPTQTFSQVVASAVSAGTASATTAARRWPRSSMTSAVAMVMTVMPVVPKVSSIHRSRSKSRDPAST